MLLLRFSDRDSFGNRIEIFSTLSNSAVRVRTLFLDTEYPIRLRKIPRIHKISRLPP